MLGKLVTTAVVFAAMHRTTAQAPAPDQTTQPDQTTHATTHSSAPAPDQTTKPDQTTYATIHYSAPDQTSQLNQTTYQYVMYDTAPETTDILPTTRSAAVVPPPDALPFPASPLYCSTDIVIVIDVSSSIPASEFFHLGQFLTGFIQCFDGTAVQIGVITYASLPKLDIPLGKFSLADPGLLGAISRLERTGGRTRTGLALHYVKCTTEFREDACAVTVVITDGTEGNGQGTDDYAAQAAMLRASGMELYAVAVGYPFLVNTAALGTITGNPDRVFSLTNSCGLANHIIEECCVEN